MEKKPKTILIVEDEEPLRQALSDKLGRADFNILTAKDGQEGLDLAIRKHPDLIFLDIIMPVMDGFTMVKKFREEEAKTGDLSKGRTPIIFLTNLSDEGALSTGQKEGVYEYLVKASWTLDSIAKKAKDTLGM